MADVYMLNRSVPESERLSIQHNVYTNAAGYLLHPVIAESLPKDARVAEIATGTAVWLQDLAKELPPSTSFDGFDISSAMFPPDKELPGNVKLHVQDVKTPFPDHFIGSFDAVHIRLLVCALHTHEDWVDVARSAFTLLKPGGYIQWCESAFTDILPGGLRREGVQASARQPAADRHIVETVGFMGDILRRGWSTLPEIFRNDLGCSQVLRDVFSTDRAMHDPDLARRTSSYIAILPFSNMYSAMCAAGRITDSKEEQEKHLADIREDFVTDMEQGFYIRWNIHVAVGRKAS